MFMKGTRVEVLTMARDPARSSVHLVVLDCASDVMQWIPSIE